MFFSSSEYTFVKKLNMPAKPLVDDTVIKRMLRRGKTYTDIMLKCHCSPSRISVIKKQMEQKAKAKAKKGKK